MDVKGNLSLFEKGIDNVLLLPHKFLSLLEAIGLALDVDNGTMVERYGKKGESGLYTVSSYTVAQWPIPCPTTTIILLK